VVAAALREHLPPTVVAVIASENCDEGHFQMQSNLKPDLRGPGLFRDVVGT